MKNIIIGLILMLPLLLAGPAQAAGELIGGQLDFKGVVVAIPCSIAPESESAPVDFGKISTRDLYHSEKSEPIAFTLKLQDCNPQLASTVTVTFSGSENPNLKDHLAIKPSTSNGASGIGIGLLEEDNTPIQLGVATLPVTLKSGMMQLNFKAFVAAEPEALSKETLTTGPFTATANYILNYQ
ncbi:fimbrial protein [bacteria symbiont BFo1 of Frankliniella occidentalis]|nr:fimbrial protein [bacteria symbiont BFo1 of Frankliniella occidentalis]KYP86710.1 fimbrial protein [bacteria symbiont BFo1 of Frankliniella occidentalis]KYP92154.1 fimbrial protein [bacteria symbiont BFo1 of Frankliniella occidentalis]